VPRRSFKDHSLPAVRPPIQRMLHIHKSIHAGKFPNTRSLAAELEVCVRSVGRDIEFMRDRMELPILYDMVRHGFYYEGEVTAFPSVTISEGELFALAVAEKALQQYRGTNFERPLMSALQKISESLPDAVSLNLNEWNESISFRTSAEAIVDLSTFDKIAQATSRREQLRITYRKPAQKECEERVVDPYHLANVNGEWFLFAYDHLRKAIRTFVPARIVSVEKTGEKFQKDPGFSIRGQLRDSFGVHSGRGEFKVLLRFSESVADFIREKKWHPSQKVRELKNGGLELQMTLSSLVEVERWILSWGGNARVLEPMQLRDNVRAAAMKIVKGESPGRVTRPEISRRRSRPSR
jgi:predicted DNA-binding transcriptional regulator YafY